ncbi:bifunctional RNase H/acid phosphatase [Streptomyces sp. SID8385]|uniref:bifunctional RNase H/acid phosphatase n=1 Tax=Streptomyces TaxID=1883 RepID=UPI0013614C91|nr:bifunctional RNase H/acid phosphatase [Streptomyces sp. SID8385]
MRQFAVEADGGSRGNPGPAGYGAVVVDAATGETLTETAGFLGTATNNTAEYHGLIAGLRAARDLHPEARVEVRMDSRLVVEQMAGRWRIKHPGLRELAAEAAGILAPDQVTYVWIPRAENQHADRLANEAMDAGARGERWNPAASTADLPAPTPPPAAAPPDLSTPTTFVLLRHGETALTPEKRFSGSGGSDPALSEAGRRQAARTAEALAARGTVEAVVSSPLLRCRQTAEAVAGRLGLPVTVDQGLRETAFGAWEGLTFGEVRERWPEELNAWLASPDAAPAGGESFGEVAARVAETRDRLRAAHAGRTVLLVSHVTPVKTLVRLALGAPWQALFRMELAAASLSEIACYADGNASVRLLNDTGHLR